MLEFMGIALYFFNSLMNIKLKKTG